MDRLGSYIERNARGTFARTVLSGGDQALSGIFTQAIAAPSTPLRVELSARVDQWNNNNGHSIDPVAGNQTYENRSKTSFSPRLGVRYALLSNLSLHGAVYRAFRAPNLGELYRKQITATTVTIPNPNLAPETAFGREIGLDWQPAGWLQLKGTYYVADYRDFNVPTAIATGSPGCGNAPNCRQRLNVNASRSTGAEGYLAVRPMAQLFVSGSVLDANVQRELLPGFTGFVSVENIANTAYQVNLTAATNGIASLGLPRTIRAGLRVERF